MQRESILDQALNLLEQQGLASNSLERLTEITKIPLSDLSSFWPDNEALLYDALRYHAQQVDIWHRQRLLDESLSPQQKLLARYERIAEQVQNGRYPGCLFIAACNFFPDIEHPIHQLAEQQKRASYQYTLSLLDELESDDSELVATQMELILEGCLSKLLVKHQLQDVSAAKRLAEDVLQISQCRKNGALG